MSEEKKAGRRRTLAPVPAQQEAAPVAQEVVPAQVPMPIRVPPAPENVEQRERRHEALARSSPLSLSFQLVGCQLARAIEATGQVVPVGYEFSVPCVRGYDAPSQECRTCGYCVIRPVGEAAAFQNRYHGHGMVIPITEPQADAIVEALESEGAVALKRPTWEAHHAAMEAKIAQQHEDEARARAMERQQMGPYATAR